VNIMNWKTLAFASALALGLGGAAVADETVGKITAIDTAKAEVTLDDGNTYTFGGPSCTSETLCKVDVFNVGDEVRIVWSDMQGVRTGQEISPVQ
jgi:hypothetical protein